MKASISVITLGVDDLERAYRFYHDGLGLASEGIVGKEFELGSVAFFDLQTGLKLALWPRTSLATDTGLAVAPTNSIDLMLAHNVASKAEVDALMVQAETAGATIIKAAQTTFWGGYAGCFMDPDQHLWEVVWNPKWVLPD